jgi:signal transduction histidine kinase
VDTWHQIRHDPGAVLLVLRHARAPDGVGFLPLPALLESPTIPQDALHLLDHEGPAFVDWAQPPAHTVYQSCLAYAGQSWTLAARTGLCDPEAAWVAGLLAGLGWQAMCAVDAPAVAACCADPALASDPCGTQRRHWGLDHTSIARRLARRWRLPDWLAAVTGRLALPASVALARGGDPMLFRLVRLAVARTPEPGLFLGAQLAIHAEEDRQVLGLAAASLGQEGVDPSVSSPARADQPILVDHWADPRRTPLLRDLLAAAAEVRRLRGQAIHSRLEAETDDLHRALESLVQQEARRVQTARLEALGEFAAGAGHEINNPLAVISGQAQYLLGHAAEWFDAEIESEATRSLQAILAQARRIHGLLREMMLFARPGPPCHGWFDLPTLLGEVAAAHSALAAERRVRIDLAGLPERLAVWADPAQVRLALGCLLRNAIEAAPAEGWARLTLSAPPKDRVEILVEDSGSGPDPAHRAALFDPFFSGRSAGRGRGLGLPIAWRLARLQGGEVRLEPRRDGVPTRFVLALPRCLPQSDGAHPQTDAA